MTTSNNTTVIKETTSEVLVKQRKNGSWYANLTKIETACYCNSVSKTLKMSEGKIYKSVTIINKWDSRPFMNSVKVIWNEK